MVAFLHIFAHIDSYRFNMIQLVTSPFTGNIVKPSPMIEYPMHPLRYSDNHPHCYACPVDRTGPGQA